MHGGEKKRGRCKGGGVVDLFSSHASTSLDYVAQAKQGSQGHRSRPVKAFLARKAMYTAVSLLHPARMVRPRAGVVNSPVFVTGVYTSTRQKGPAITLYRSR